MTEGSPVVAVRGLTKKFKRFTAVDCLDFDLLPNCTTALLGSNGAGKTTTISMLLGLLLPHREVSRFLVKTFYKTASRFFRA